MIVDIFVILLIIAIGIVFYTGKGAVIVEWFNTMPRPDKEKRDMRALSVFIGKLFFVAAVLVGIITVGDVFKIFWLSIAGVVLLIGDVLFGYFYTHTGNRFNKK